MVSGPAVKLARMIGDGLEKILRVLVAWCEKKPWTSPRIHPLSLGFATGELGKLWFPDACIFNSWPRLKMAVPPWTAPGVACGDTLSTGREPGGLQEIRVWYGMITPLGFVRPRISRTIQRLS